MTPNVTTLHVMTPHHHYNFHSYTNCPHETKNKKKSALNNRKMTKKMMNNKRTRKTMNTKMVVN
jgi:hypothetical protein